jgi:hypothetical protein
MPKDPSIPTTPNTPNSQFPESAGDSNQSRPPLVNAETIGAQYGVTGRYILKLAAADRIPCLRLGKKCVRFNPEAVAKALVG